MPISLGKAAIASPGNFRRANPRETTAKNGKSAPRKAKPPVDLTKAVKLSESKIHDGDLYQTEDAFVVAKPQPNGSPHVVFQLKRNLCGKEISAEEAERLVEFGKTGLIEGFVSKRGSILQRLPHAFEGQEESGVRISAALNRRASFRGAQIFFPKRIEISCALSRYNV